MVEENDACGWFLGDSVESPSNMTATLLSYASLYAVDIPPHETETYLKERLGGNTDEDIVQGFSLIMEKT
ncbi:hypothetical protein M5E82_16405 [Parabacteroides distasonis]|nr:hypothetical protein M5E82_16405 [Parabacteroides distasonis]